MRKLCCIWLCCVLLCPCAVAEQESALYDRACWMAQKLDELCSCAPYMQLFTSDTEILGMIAEWTAGEHGAPYAAYYMALDDTPGLLQAMAGIDVQLPEVAMQQLRQRVLATIPTQVNAMLGSKTLAATSMCQYGESFVADGTNCLFYLRYADGADVVVTFAPTGDGVMSGTAVFLAAEFSQDVEAGLGFRQLK